MPIDDDSCIIVLKIPQSYSAPHMVTFQKTSRFFARNSAGKYQLEVQEIRHAFIESESLPERIRNFRADRLSKIEADETPVPVKRLPRFVAHLVPLNAFLHSYSAAKIEFNQEAKSQIRSASPYSRLTHNFDGMYSTDGLSNGQCHAYCQIFRNGVIEIVKVLVSTIQPNNPIPCISYESELIEEFGKHLSLCKNIGIELPIFLMISLLNVKGVTMALGGYAFNDGSSGRPIDRQSLLMSEIYIDNYEINPELLLKPFFDSLWQACGLERSFNYDADGRWKPKY